MQWSASCGEGSVYTYMVNTTSITGNRQSPDLYVLLELQYISVQVMNIE